MEMVYPRHRRSDAVKTAQVCIYEAASRNLKKGGHAHVNDNYETGIGKKRFLAFRPDWLPRNWSILALSTSSLR